MATDTGNPDIDPGLDQLNSSSSPPAEHDQQNSLSPLPVASLDEPLEAEASSDSAYGESLYSDLASLTSNITRGVWENGRRYHSYGKSQYAFPNDEAEADRLDMQHAMMSHLLGDRLFWAPIGQDPQKVLDLGTGTGIWAIDFADMFPSAEVIGTDLSAIQPHWLPPNLSFQIDDAELDWTWKTQCFDYIHNRNFVCAIRDWPKLIRQSFEFVKPGGWVEWHEKHPWLLSDDGTLSEENALYQWGKHFFEASVIFGADAMSPRLLKQRMEEAGFINVEEHILKLPVGGWPKDIRLKKCGLFEVVNMTEGISGLTMMLFTRCLGWSATEVEVFLTNVRKEAKDRRIHSYYHFYVVLGQRPSV